MVYPDPLLGWRRPPGLAYTHIRRDFRTSVQFNSEGFRDREHARLKPENTYRIAVLGDSFTEGVEVPLEGTFHGILQKRLNGLSRKERRQYEAINFGVGGYSTAQEYLVLRTRAIRYRPDLVILAFFVGNDVYANGRKYELRYAYGGDPRPYFVFDGEGTDLRLILPPEERLTAMRGSCLGFGRISGCIKRFLWGHSYLFGMVAKRVKRIRGLSGFLTRMRIVQKNLSFRGLIFSTEDVEELDEAWKVTEGLLLMTARLARENGAEFLVVIIPDPIQLDPYLREYEEIFKDTPVRVDDPTRPNRRLAEFLRRSGIRHVDLLPYFRTYLRRPAPRRLYFKYDGHMSREGHRLAADAIFCKMAREGLAFLRPENSGPRETCAGPGGMEGGSGREN